MFRDKSGAGTAAAVHQASGVNQGLLAAKSHLTGKAIFPFFLQNINLGLLNLNGKKRFSHFSSKIHLPWYFNRTLSISNFFLGFLPFFKNNLISRTHLGLTIFGFVLRHVLDTLYSSDDGTFHQSVLRLIFQRCHLFYSSSVSITSSILTGLSLV